MENIDWDSSMKWISTNAWWLVLSTVAILVGSYYSVFDRVERYIKRPKLTYKTETRSEIKKNEQGEEYQLETFWIYVSNNGKDRAKNCSVKMKITDTTSSKDAGDTKTLPYKYGIFPVDWTIGTGKNLLLIFSQQMMMLQ